MAQSFVNFGAYIGPSSTIDACANIGSCAHIGSNVHISSGVIIGGVLEPANQRGVYIADNTLVGANSSISEGVTIGSHVTIGAGTHITASTHVVDGETGEELEKAYIPNNSLCVNGTYQRSERVSMQCVVLFRRKSRRKTIIDEKCHQI
jgi:2,3,4,5-tetrahydropyridine-2-carboxylate N-succinyltransferase